MIRQHLNRIKLWTRFLLCVSISFLFFSCNKEKLYEPNKNFNKKPTQVMQNISLYRSNEGKVQAKLISPIVQYFAGDSARTVFPKGINVLFYNDDLTDKATLTANYAINYTANSKIVYLRDSIRIININTNDTIYCKDMYWNQDNHTVYTNLPIRRYNSAGESFGDGMISNEQFDSITVIRPHGKEIVSDENEKKSTPIK